MTLYEFIEKKEQELEHEIDKTITNSYEQEDMENIKIWLYSSLRECAEMTAARICDPGTPGNYRDKSDAWLTNRKPK